MSRKKEKEDVDMEEGETPLGLGKPEELPSNPRGW